MHLTEKVHVCCFNNSELVFSVQYSCCVAVLMCSVKRFHIKLTIVAEKW